MIRIIDRPIVMSQDRFIKYPKLVLQNSIVETNESSKYNHNSLSKNNIRFSQLNQGAITNAFQKNLKEIQPKNISRYKSLPKIQLTAKDKIESLQNRFQTSFEDETYNLDRSFSTDKLDQIQTTNPYQENELLQRKESPKYKFINHKKNIDKKSFVWHQSQKSNSITTLLRPSGRELQEVSQEISMYRQSYREQKASKSNSKQQSDELTLREVNLSHDKEIGQQLFSLPTNEKQIQKNDLDSGGITIVNSSTKSFNKIPSQKQTLKIRKQTQSKNQYLQIYKSNNGEVSQRLLDDPYKADLGVKTIGPQIHSNQKYFKLQEYKQRILNQQTATILQQNEAILNNNLRKEGQDVDKKTEGAFKKMFQKNGLIHSQDPTANSEMEFGSASQLHNDKQTNDELFQDSILQHSTQETSRMDGIKHSQSTLLIYQHSIIDNSKSDLNTSVDNQILLLNKNLSNINLYSLSRNQKQEILSLVEFSERGSHIPNFPVLKYTGGLNSRQVDKQLRSVPIGQLKKNLPYDRVFGKLAHKRESSQQDIYEFLQEMNHTASIGQQKAIVSKSTVSPSKIKCVPKIHEIQLGIKPHLQKYKDGLINRRAQLQERIQDEYDQLDDHNSLMELAEARAKQREVEEAQDKLDDYNRAKKIRHNRQSQQHGLKIQTDSEDEDYVQNKLNNNSLSQKDLKVLQAEKFDQKLAEIPSTDTLDFALWENIQGCSNCRNLKGSQQSRSYMKDPGMYNYLKNYRKLLKKDRIRNEDLGDDPSSIIIKRKPKAQQIAEAILKHELESGQVGKSEERIHLELKMIEKEEICLQKFYKWQRVMWKRIEEIIIQKELAKRPKYIQLYQKAVDQHMVDFIIEFDRRTVEEQAAREDLRRDPKKLGKFKELLRYMIKEDNIGSDDFFENLLVVKNEQDRNNYYFDEVKDVLFTTKKLTTRQSLLEDVIYGERTVVEEDDTLREIKLIEELMHHRNRVSFLQTKVGAVQIALNREYTKDVELEFAKASKKNMGVPEPSLIINPECIDQKYVIINKGITEQQIKSIAQSFKDFENNIKQIYLTNNRMSGKCFEQLLRSLSSKQQSQVQSIVYGGQNELSQESYVVLRDLYLNKNHEVLKELKLINPLIRDQGVLQNLLGDILANLRLKTLSISGLELEPKSFQSLVSIVSLRAACLQNVDLSWCKIRSDQMAQLFGAIRHNNHLVSLNLAFNPVSKADALTELGAFLKRCTNLQHLDLSGVLQTSIQVKRVVKKAKRSHSLVALHLSHSLCINGDVGLQLYIEQKLDIKNAIVRHKDQIQTFQKFQNPEDLVDNIPNWKNKYSLVQLAKIQQRQIRYYKEQRVQGPSDNNNIHDFVLQRTIAHNEIVGNTKWVLGSECYVCNRWCYTLFVMPKAEISTISGSYELLHSCSQRTKLIDIREYARSIVESSGNPDIDRESYLKLLPGATYQELFENLHGMNILKQRFKEKDITLYQEHNVWSCAIKDLKMKQFKVLPTSFNYEQFLRKHEMTSPGTDPELFVFADYVKPARRVETLHMKNEMGTMEDLFIPQVRLEPLPIFNLNMVDKAKADIPFNKNKSVFKPWVRDTKASLCRALEYDSLNWKLPRLITDPDQLALVQKTLQQYFAKIKDVYIKLISSDSYPSIGLIEFTEFCKETKIKDSTIQFQTLDRMFIAANSRAPGSAAVPAGANNGNNLNRSEFLEVLVRIANVKYREPGIVETFNEALIMLLDSMLSNCEVRPWQEFRDQDLWNNELDAVFKCNEKALRLVHDKLFPRFSSKIRDTLDLFSKGSSVDLTVQEVTFSFGMSKMTVEDEMVKFSDYQKLKYVEWLEFLARCAYAKYVGDETVPLAVKLEQILDSVLPVFGLKRKEAEEDIGDDDTSEESVFIEDEDIEKARGLMDYFEELIFKEK